jgi:hypothetical protein
VGSEFFQSHVDFEEVARFFPLQVMNATRQDHVIYVVVNTAKAQASSPRNGPARMRVPISLFVHIHA